MKNKDVLLSIRDKELNDRMQMLKDGFEQLSKVDVRQVPEVIFVNYFLPLFCGEDTPMDKMELLSQWYVIAGNNYAPVNVVNSSGEFIIQVPPIHDRSVTNKTDNSKENIDYVFKHAKEKSTLSPVMGQNIITNYLKSVFDKMSADTDSKISEQWVKLFKHYGKIKEISVPEKQLEQQADGDEFDY